MNGFIFRKHADIGLRLNDPCLSRPSSFDRLIVRDLRHSQSMFSVTSRDHMSLYPSINSRCIVKGGPERPLRSRFPPWGEKAASIGSQIELSILSFVPNLAATRFLRTLFHCSESITKSIVKILLSRSAGQDDIAVLFTA